MEILNKTYNQLLSRVEVQFDLSFPAATPSLADVKKLVAEKMKTAEELVVVQKIATQFGLRKAKVSAYIYDSKEAHDKIEPKPKVKKEAVVAPVAPTPAKK